MSMAQGPFFQVWLIDRSSPTGIRNPGRFDFLLCCLTVCMLTTVGMTKCHCLSWLGDILVLPGFVFVG